MWTMRNVFISMEAAVGDITITLADGELLTNHVDEAMIVANNEVIMMTTGGFVYGEIIMVRKILFV